jgi:hypothetical protein
MPDLPAEDLMRTYGDQMTREQQDWLSDFMDRFDNQVDDTGPGRAREDALIREYDQWSRRNTLPAQRVPQGNLMPDNLDVTDLIRAHGDRMTPEQLNWLQNFTQRWDNEVDGSPAGQGIEARMIEEYDQWLSNNRLQPDPLANLFDDLEPDPTAVANRPGQQGLAENYNTFREAMLADIRDRNVDVDLIDANRLVESIREPQHISSPLYQLADVERQALADYVEQNGWEREFRAQDPLANLRQGEGAVVRLDQVPDERIYELATRYDVPPGMVRNILTEMSDPTFRPVLLQEQADDGVGRFETLPVTSRRGVVHMIDDLLAERDQAPAPQAPAQPGQPGPLALRDPVPRVVQVMAMQDLAREMSPTLNRQSQELANTYFNDNVIDGNDVTISALSGLIRNYRVGPHADAPNEVRELAARKLEALHTESMTDAEAIADALNEAFYDDAEGPEEARTMIRRDIRTLEQHGERAWEDLAGPMADDIPWSRNTQHHLIQYLRNLLELREGFAKGGLVKKKRKANKARTPSVVTRKSPELAEMQYRYGGMVC